RRPTCRYTRKQLRIALRVSAQDDGAGLRSWPFGKLLSSPIFRDWGYSTWVPAMMPYVKNDKVFSCPNGPTTGTSWPNQALAGPKGAQMVVNLAIREYIENSEHGFSKLAAISGAKNGP